MDERPSVGQNVVLSQFSGIVWTVTKKEGDGNMRLKTKDGADHGIDVAAVCQDGGKWSEAN